MCDVNLTIRSLTPDDAPSVSAWLASQPPEYLQYFHPFAFDEPTLRRILHAVRTDVYLGFFDGDGIFALVLLRGWDEGYPIPMFGGCVHNLYQGQGWGRAGVALAKAVSRTMGATEVRLKVHPENIRARCLYGATGFVYCDVDAASGNLIYRWKE